MGPPLADRSNSRSEGRHPPSPEASGCTARSAASTGGAGGGASPALAAGAPSGVAGAAAVATSRTALQTWVLQHYCLELFLIFVEARGGFALMLDGPSKEALRDCPTQIAPREYLELDGNPYGLDEVLKMVSVFNALDGKELPSSSSKGGKVTVFKNQMNLSKISASVATVKKNREKVPEGLSYSEAELDRVIAFAQCKAHNERWYTLQFQPIKNGDALLEDGDWGHDSQPSKLFLLTRGKAVAGYGVRSHVAQCNCDGCTSTATGARQVRAAHDQIH